MFPSAVLSMHGDILKQMDETKMKWPDANRLDGSAKKAETTSIGFFAQVNIGHLNIVNKANEKRLDLWKKIIISFCVE